MDLQTELAKILLQAGLAGAVLAWFMFIHSPRQEQRQDKRDDKMQEASDLARSAFLNALENHEAAHATEMEKIGKRFDRALDRLPCVSNGRRYTGDTDPGDGG